MESKWLKELKIYLTPHNIEEYKMDLEEFKVKHEATILEHLKFNSWVNNVYETCGVPFHPSINSGMKSQLAIARSRCFDSEQNI